MTNVRVVAPCEVEDVLLAAEVLDAATLQTCALTRST